MVNIVLDLDETLIHTIVSSKIRDELEPIKNQRHRQIGGGNWYNSHNPRADFKFMLNGQHYYVFKRPGLAEFLDYIFKAFKQVGIWTAADRVYAKNIIKGILDYQQVMGLSFVFSRDFCESDHIGYYKPLTKIYKQYPSFKEKETIMLDNSLPVMRYNLDNALLAPNYEEPHLNADVFLYLLRDIFQTNLPKTSVIRYLKRTNQLVEQLNHLMQLEQPSVADYKHDFQPGVKKISKPKPKSPVRSIRPIASKPTSPMGPMGPRQATKHRANTSRTITNRTIANRANSSRANANTRVKQTAKGTQGLRASQPARPNRVRQPIRR